MADLTITAANLSIAVDTGTKIVQFGESVSAGEPVYKKTADSKYWLAQADDDAEVLADGIAITAGAADSYGVIVVSGTLNMGAILTSGQLYVVSATAGGIAPRGDLIATNRLTHLGTATSTSVLEVKIDQTGVTL